MFVYIHWFSVRIEFYIDWGFKVGHVRVRSAIQVWYPNFWISSRSVSWVRILFSNPILYYHIF